MNNKINTILISFQETNTTKIEEIIKRENQSKYIWLLLLDLLIFLSLTLTSYASSKKLKLIIKKDTTDFRYKFIKGLFAANAIRSLSLIFIIFLGNPFENNPKTWLNSLLHIIPAFIFYSAYMYLCTFLSDIYYTHIEYNNYLIKPILIFIVVIGYIILSILAFFTFVFQAFLKFYLISEFLIAILYLVLGSLIAYFGNKICSIFINRIDKFENSNEIGKKVKILTFSIGGLFILKGLSGFFSGISILDPTEYPNIYDFFWFLILEIGPTVICIYIGKKKDSNFDESNRPSLDIDMENSMMMRESSSFNVSYKPPFIKE